MLLNIHVTEAAARRYSVKKAFPEISQNSQQNTCARASFLIKLQPEAFNFVKKETLSQILCCEFCEISKEHHFFTKHPGVTASGITLVI